MTAVLTAPLPVAPRRALRDYQRGACDAVRSEWAAGRTRTAVVLPTGGGKTDVIAALAVEEAAAGGRVLVFAHRSELLDQIAQRCLMHAPTVPVGRVQAAQHSAHQRIVVAMAPTLARAKRRQRLHRPSMVIVDETHHASSPSYLTILRWAGCFDAENPTRLMGVTATLTRSDRRGLGDVFQSVAFERGIVWAVEHGPSDADPHVTAPVGQGASHGWLVRPHGRVVVGEHLDLRNARTSKGDYVEAELGEMVAQDVEAIVAAWREHAQDRLTVAFTPSIASATALGEAFRAAGVPAGEVYGSTPHSERQRIFAAVSAGRLRVLINVMVATEGFDLPGLSCVLVARPTKLPGLYTQMVGRGLRLSPGKCDCLVLDVVGASRTQKLVTLAELLPSAKVNTIEQDVAPCERCSGYVGRRPAVVKLAEERGMVACTCLCEDCALPPAECRCGKAGGRDPDGGRRRLRGRAAYADVDLLGTVAPDGPAGALNWLSTPDGVLFVAVGDRLVMLHEDGGGAWSAAHIAQRGERDQRLITEGLSLPSTKFMVARWVSEQERAGTTVYGRSASWRQGQKDPSPAQIRRAARLGVAEPETYTRGALADASDIALAVRQLAPRPKPAATWQEAHARVGATS